MNQNTPQGRAVTTMSDDEARQRWAEASIVEPPAPQLPAVSQQGRPIGIIDGVITAQPVAVRRDLAAIKARIKELAAWAGTDWIYRWTANNKDGTKGTIEGLTIKGAMNVAREWGNNEVNSRIIEGGEHWMIYSRFVDYETGFSVTRPYQQRKGQTAGGRMDAQRQLDIALAIGVSKSQRNVICNALQTVCDFAFDEAEKDLRGKIGNDLDRYRGKVLGRLTELQVDVRRVERVVGKPSKEWLAPDVAALIVELQSVGDGMASANDIWPPLDAAAAGAPPAPTREAAKPKAETTKKPAATGKKAKDEAAKAEGTPAPEGGDAGATGGPQGGAGPSNQQAADKAPAAAKKPGKYEVVNNDGEPVWDGDDPNEFCKQIILAGEKVRTDKKLLDGIWETHLPAILGLSKTLQNYMMQHYPQFEE